MPAPIIQQPTRRMWRAIVHHNDWKATAFCAFAEARGLPMDKGQVSRMISGKRKTCSDTLRLLAEFLGDWRLVYGPHLAMLEPDDLDEDEGPELSPDQAARLLVSSSARANEAAATNDARALHDALDGVSQALPSLHAFMDHLDEEGL